MHTTPLSLRLSNHDVMTRSHWTLQWQPACLGPRNNWNEPCMELGSFHWAHRLQVCWDPELWTDLSCLGPNTACCYAWGGGGLKLAGRAPMPWLHLLFLALTTACWFSRGHVVRWIGRGPWLHIPGTGTSVVAKWALHTPPNSA